MYFNSLSFSFRHLIGLKIILIASLLLFNSSNSFAADLSERDTIFQQFQSENILFYIQRSADKNTVIYVLNTNEKGAVDKENPIKVFWINYEENNKRTPLTYIQNHFSYGINSEMLNSTDYQFNLEGYDERFFYLKLNDAGEYTVYATLNNQEAQIKKLFIQIEGGSFWFPNIKHVKVEGVALTTNEKIFEILKP